MPDFSKSKIYVIKNSINDYIYVGSTTLKLNERFNLHKCDRTCSLYRYVATNFNDNWDDFYIELLEDFSCNSRDELNQKESEYLNTFNHIINKNKPVGAIKHREYYQKNKPQIQHYQKQYNFIKKLRNITMIFIMLYVFNRFTA